MDIVYKVNEPISTDQFIDILNQSTLANRRPVEDKLCMEGMILNSNLCITAWANDELVGIARSVTDFHYACYLSDLAVKTKYQKCGIGKQLQRLTQKQLGPKCSLILLAAPAANRYYEHIGLTHNPRCWVIEPESTIMN